MSQARYQLDASKVLSTVWALRDRIGERFPDSGLREQAEELAHIAERTSERVEWFSRPIWAVRAFTFLLIFLLGAGVLFIVLSVRAAPEGWVLKDVLEMIDSGLNDLVMTGLGIFFLMTLETRIKRRRALHAIHELRSMAHVIDMHQLTKDPDRLLHDRDNTTHSPKNSMSAFELRRYLDYCSEMLSLTSKIASTYLQNFDDSVAVAAVNEIEDLTSGLSRKIWQKIMIVQSIEGR